MWRASTDLIVFIQEPAGESHLRRAGEKQTRQLSLFGSSRRCSLGQASSPPVAPRTAFDAAPQSLGVISNAAHATGRSAARPRARVGPHATAISTDPVPVRHD
jgi:hypothetical protein